MAFWNVDSTLLAVGSIIGLVCAPIYIIFASYRFYFHYDDNAKYRNRYMQFFKDLHRRSFWAVNYNAIFFVRRYIMICVLIFYKKGELLQINVFQLTCVFVLGYIMEFKPFKAVDRNR